MNNLFYWLWLADIFDAISGLSLLIVLGYFISFGVCFIAFCMSWSGSESLSEFTNSVSDRLSKYKRIFKVLLLPLLISLILVIALPSKKTIYISLGASVTADLAENSTAQKALQLLNNKLDDLLVQEEEEKK